MKRHLPLVATSAILVVLFGVAAFSYEGFFSARVIVNLCIDRRRRARSVPLEEVPEMADTAPGADDVLALEERRQRVATALAELPDRQRAAVVLSYYEGLSNAEVAGALEISVGAVESLLVRARRSLAGLLADLARTEGVVT